MAGRAVGGGAHLSEGAGVGEVGPAQRLVEGPRGGHANANRRGLQPLPFEKAHVGRPCVSLGAQQAQGLVPSPRQEHPDARAIAAQGQGADPGTLAAVQGQVGLGERPQQVEVLAGNCQGGRALALLLGQVGVAPGAFGEGDPSGDQTDYLAHFTV